MGCPNDCIFCNQKVITAKTAPVAEEDVKNIIEERLPTLTDRGLETLEIAFFGGSFTGIPIKEQQKYLGIALDYKNKGIVDKIRLSTRPDYINPEILGNLRKYKVDTIELGVQSMDDRVLAMSRRGHTSEDVRRACSLIRDYDFTLGIQLMIGLPGDTPDTAACTAEKVAAIGPEMARLYPTVVLENTVLAKMCRSGAYIPLTEDDAVAITMRMYVILQDAGIDIIRVGLKSTDLITHDADLGGSYHPAFRQLVEGRIAKNRILAMLRELKSSGTITICSNRKWFSDMIGHKGCNKKFFEENFPQYIIKYAAHDSLPDNTYNIIRGDDSRGGHKR